MVNTDEAILENLAVKVITVALFLRDGRYEDAVAVDEECMKLALFLGTDEGRSIASHMLDRMDALLMDRGIEVFGTSVKR